MPPSQDVIPAAGEAGEPGTIGTLGRREAGESPGRRPQAPAADAGTQGGGDAGGAREGRRAPAGARRLRPRTQDQSAARMPAAPEISALPGMSSMLRAVTLPSLTIIA